MPYRFLDAQTIQSFVSRLADNDWMGQIVGPHGCGKSTFVKSLIPVINRQIHLVTIHQQDSKSKVYRSLLKTINECDSGHLLIIDGFEQLSFWRRGRVIHTCKRRQTGLLVTVHQSVNLPTIFEMPISLDLFCKVVDELLADTEQKLPTTSVERAFQKFQPNLREALFSLYDEFELYRTQTDPRSN